MFDRVPNMPLEYSKQFSQSDLKNLIFKHFPDATRYRKQLINLPFHWFWPNLCGKIRNRQRMIWNLNAIPQIFFGRIQVRTWGTFIPKFFGVVETHAVHWRHAGKSTQTSYCFVAEENNNIKNKNYVQKCHLHLLLEGA